MGHTPSITKLVVNGKKTVKGFTGKGEIFMATFDYDLPGAPQTGDVVEFGNWALENDYTITLTQVVNPVKHTTRSENTGPWTDGRGRFFLVEGTIGPDHPLSAGKRFLVGVGYSSHDYFTYLIRLGLVYQWHLGCRFQLFK